MKTLFKKMVKPTASILLGSIFLQAFMPVYAYAFSNNDQPIANKLMEYVDPFTGDFSYNIPLLNISGPNGENYPLNLKYNSGIKVNQESSWVGLGWDLHIDEISRVVKGYADDLNSDNNIATKTKGTTVTNDEFNVYGPLYFKNFNYQDPNSIMDTYQSNRKLSKGLAFEFPDYDDYFVSGMGKMRPYIFDYATITQKNTEVESSVNSMNGISYNYDNVRNANSVNNQPFTKDPEFRFESELSKNIIPNAISNSYHGSIKTPKELIGYSGLNVNDKYFHTNGDVLDYSTRSIAYKGKQVYFFTNENINANYSNLKSNSKFLDYKVVSPEQYSNSRPSNEFPSKGIGAFQVIDENGITYHYSLPVYSFNEEVNSFVFKDEVLSTSNFNTIDPYRLIDGDQEFNSVKKVSRVANSWKLTAITGPDFVDNGDGIAGDGDIGYWISLDYGKWTSNFQWRAPFFGVYTTNVKNIFLPDIIFKAKYTLSNYHNRILREGSYSTGSNEEYYLNSIETATQKVLFVKDIKADGHSVPLLSTSLDAIPKLRIKEIILFNKKDVLEINFKNANLNSYGNKLFSTFVNSNEIIDVYDIDILDNNNELRSKSLKSIKFNSDYSLCKGIYNNLNNRTKLVERINYRPSSSLGYNNLLGISNNSSNNIGKLTLLELQFLEQGATQIYPSYKFDYHQNNLSENPNFMHDMQDFWGYYKSDFHPRFRGHYTTSVSANNVDVWSIKKITTPIGSEILVDYESDKYESIGYDENEEIVKNFDVNAVNKNLLQRIFQVNNVLDGQNNDNGKAFFLDNDVFHFYQNPSEDRAIPKDFRIPLYRNNVDIFEFKCSNGSAPDKVPSYGANINSSSANRPSDGNYMTITQQANSICQNTPSITENLGALTYYKAGFLIQYLKSAYGGGVRVKTIRTKDPVADISYGLELKYMKGIATSEPDYFGSMDEIIKILNITNVGADRAIPSSMVGYSKVEIYNIGTKLSSQNLSLDESIGKTLYEFYNYNNSEYHTKEDVNTYSENNQIDFYTNAQIIVNDYHNLMHGRKKRVTNFDSQGNSISNIEYNYIQVPTSQEIFFTYYSFAYDDLFSNVRRTFYRKLTFRKHNFVSLLQNVKTINNGFVTSESVTNAQDYNLLTGKSNRIVDKDISGRIIETIIEPAFLKTAYSAFGPKFQSNSTNLNQLNNIAKVSKYEVERGDIKTSQNFDKKTLLSSVVTDWSNTCNKRIYNSSLAKFYNLSNQNCPYYSSSSKTYNGQTNESLWDVNSKIYLLDNNNRVLEVKDGMNRSTSLKYNYYGNGVLAKAVNSNYSSFTFSSFEDKIPIDGNNFEAGGEVRIYDGSYRIQSNSTIKAHSGNYLSSIPASQEFGPHYKTFVDGENGLEVNRKYVAKVWIHQDSDPNAKIFIRIKGLVNGNSVDNYVEKKLSDEGNLKLGDWVLVKVEMFIPNNFTTPNANDFINVGLAKSPNGPNAYFDDFMFSPVDASVEGYIINFKNQLKEGEINNDGLSMKYEYDKAGRIVLTSKESSGGMKIISKNKYNFGR